MGRLEEQLSQLPKEELTQVMNDSDQQVFSNINCLDCANCCKTAGPIIEPDEITELAKAIQIPASTFITEYLTMDEDGDFIMQSLPCPLLNLSDNTCSIYEQRPKACREYPHTAGKTVTQYLDILEPNKEICPAVEQILERISHHFNIEL